ncbi:MAG TPA: SPOR domain-containing protein [Steroidobacteraceae bacterium]|nr:SPOR domain-containing protein [Steroidobacteraceae bacterium]
MPTTITFRAAKAVLAAALLTIAGCSAEQQDWRAAEAAGTSEAYKNFLEQHPNSELAGKARERVGDFAEDRDWQQAAKLGTADAYQGFLAAHPDGRWSQEARIRLESSALGSIARMEQEVPGQTASRPAGVKLLRLASASPTVPAGALAVPSPGATAAAPAPATTAPAAAGSAAVAPAGTGYAVQLGAFGTPGSANREWQRLKLRFGAQLAGLTPQVVRAGTSSGQLYRLQARAGGEAQARAICATLKAQSQPCVPVIPH